MFIVLTGSVISLRRLGCFGGQMLYFETTQTSIWVLRMLIATGLSLLLKAFLVSRARNYVVFRRRKMNCEFRMIFPVQIKLTGLSMNSLDFYSYLFVILSVAVYIMCEYISSVRSLSCVQLFATPWTAAHQASLSITNCQSLLKLMSIESVMPSNHFILCRPLLLPRSIFPSIRVFSNESALHIRWPKYWSFSFSISPSNEYSGLISFRIDWLNLLAVQGTLKSLLQYHSWKASIFRCLAFFMVQLSYPYMTTGKTIALTRLFQNDATNIITMWLIQFSSYLSCLGFT